MEVFLLNRLCILKYNVECSEIDGGRSEACGGRLEGHGDSSELSGGCSEGKNGRDLISECGS